MTKPGDRVGAILSADQETVKLLGYGVYAGDEIPPPSVDQYMFVGGVPNPKIVLDSGEIVWGCQCWWGAEDKARRVIGGRRVVDVRIEEDKPHDPE